MNTTNNSRIIFIGIHVSGFYGGLIYTNEVYPPRMNIRSRQVGIFGQVMFLSGPIVWGVIWDGGGYKKCAETSLNYERFRKYIITTSKRTPGGLNSLNYFKVYYN